MVGLSTKRAHMNSKFGQFFLFKSVVQPGCIVIGIVFVISGLLKLQLPFEFLSVVYSYQIFNQHIGFFVALFLPYLELVLGTFLVMNLFPFEVLCWVFLSTCVFLIAQLWALFSGLSIACGCFGGSATDLIGYSSLGRTFLLFIGIFFLLRHHVNTQKNTNAK